MFFPNKSKFFLFVALQQTIDPVIVQEGPKIFLGKLGSLIKVFWKIQAFSLVNCVTKVTKIYCPPFLIFHVILCPWRRGGIVIGIGPSIPYWSTEFRLELLLADKNAAGQSAFLPSSSCYCVPSSVVQKIFCLHSAHNSSQLQSRQSDGSVHCSKEGCIMQGQQGYSGCFIRYQLPKRCLFYQSIHYSQTYIHKR